MNRAIVIVCVALIAGCASTYTQHDQAPPKQHESLHLEEVVITSAYQCKTSNAVDQLAFMCGVAMVQSTLGYCISRARGIDDRSKLHTPICDTATRAYLAGDGSNGASWACMLSKGIDFYMNEEALMLIDVPQEGWIRSCQQAAIRAGTTVQ